MKIQFAEIPSHGLTLEIKDQAWFPDRDIARAGPVRARVQLQKKGSERVLLTGDLTIPLALECDRCLQEFNRKITHSFQVDLEVTEDDALVPEEHRCSAAEMDMLYLREPEIDIFPVLAQQVYLLMPGKKICSEACRGLCPRCGINRNKEICRCQPDETPNPFAVLASLKP
jgi:uncharacterized protein